MKRLVSISYEAKLFGHVAKLHFVLRINEISLSPPPPLSLSLSLSRLILIVVVEVELNLATRNIIQP